MKPSHEALPILYAIAGAVNRSLDLVVVLDDALDKVLEVMDIEAGAIYLLDPERETLSMVAHRGFTDEIVREIGHLRLGEEIAGKVVTTGQAVMVHDLSNDPRVKKELTRRQGWRSYLCIPLRAKEKILGTMFVVSRRYHLFTEHDQALFTAVGDQIGTAVENARLHEATRRRALELSALVETSKSLAAENKWEVLLPKILEELGTTFPHAQAALYLLDEPGGRARLVPASDRWLAATGWSKTTLRRHARRAMALGRPLLVADGDEVPAGTDARQTRGTLLLMPVAFEERHLGVIALASPVRAAFGSHELELVTAFAGLVAVAIERSRLFEMESKRALKQSLLFQLVKSVTSAVNLTSTLEVVVRVSAVLLAAPVGLLSLVGEDRQILVVQVAHGPRCRALRDQRVPIAEPTALWMQNPTAPPPPGAFTEITATLAGRGVGRGADSVVNVPLVVRGQLVGVLTLAGEGRGWYASADVGLLRAFADHAAIAIENARLYNRVQEREREIKELLAKYMLAQESDRKRIALGIHDGAIQFLVGALYRAETCLQRAGPDPELAFNLRCVADILRQTIGELRRTVFDLRPAILDGAGLVPALRTYAQWIAGEHGLRVDVESQGNWVDLPFAVETAIFRVAQEALSNTAKHARATTVAVSLRLAGDEVRLAVEDDGVGFDPRQQPAPCDSGNGIGLGGMRERATLLGGRLEVASAPGTGTRISLIIPRSTTEGRHEDAGKGTTDGHDPNPGGRRSRGGARGALHHARRTTRHRSGGASGD